jgi:hypothetical protein
MTPIKHLLDEIHESSRTVRRYEVESPSRERVFLIGSAEEALAALGAEAA